MQPSLSKFIKITPCCRATKLVNFQIISTLSNESWNKILPSLYQAFTTHHPNVFTPILPLSEGRAGIAWVPSNKMLFFPLRYKAPLAFLPDVFSLLLLLYCPFRLSLSLRLQRVNIGSASVLHALMLVFFKLLQDEIRGVMLTTHPHLVPRSRMSRSYTSSPPKLHRGV
jgi:hypothetical protein